MPGLRDGRPSQLLLQQLLLGWKGMKINWPHTDQGSEGMDLTDPLERVSGILKGSPGSSDPRPHLEDVLIMDFDFCIL